MEDPDIPLTADEIAKLFDAKNAKEMADLLAMNKLLKELLTATLGGLQDFDVLKEQQKNRELYDK